MRIRGVKSELEAAGEDTEGMVENTAKLQEKIMALTNIDGSGGVNILTNTGEFKSTYEILLEISRVWDKINDQSQASLLETLAGKTRGSVVAGLLQNGDILESSYNEVQGSSGSSQEELQKYMDSIQGKTDQLTNSFQTMWNNALSSDLLKFLLDVANALVKITDFVGPLNVAFSSLVGKITFDSGIGVEFKNLKKDTGSISKAFKELGQSGKIASLGTNLLTGAITGLASMVIGFVLEKAFEWVDNWIHRAEILKEEVNELKETFESAKETFESNIDTLTKSSDSDLYLTLEDEFRALTRGVDAYGNNLSLTTDQYERYKDICEKIVGINPSIASGYDSATKAIGNNASALSELIELQKYESRQNVDKLISDENLGKIAKDAKNDVYDATSSSNVDIYQTSREAWAALVKSSQNNLKEEYIVGTSVLTKDINNSGGIEDEVAKYVLEQLDYTSEEIDNIFSNYWDGHAMRFNTSGFMRDYYNEIIANVNDFGMEYKLELSNALGSVKQAIFDGEKDISEAQDALVDTFLFVPKGQSAGKYYDQLNDASKKFIAEWIRNSSQFKVDNNQTEQAAKESRDNIIKMVKDLSNGAISGDFQGNWMFGQDLLEQFYNFDESSVDWEKYKWFAQEFRNSLWTMIGEDKNKYGINDITELDVLFGINFVETEDKIDKANEQISGHINMTTEQIQEKLDSMNAKQIKAYYSVDWNEVDWDNVNSWQDVVKLIDQQANTTQNIVSFKTITDISSTFADYNEILKQTEEIIIDNTEVTQEYKDSLKELGVSEEELKDCFDETNPLIVNDAKALNDLVKSSKNSIAQNAKLAKSQARLQYYEKYKELKALTNGQKINNTATLNQVKALYAEMTALQKTISRYSMLEHQLLGTTNAYEEFTKAQEIDEANDYETKAEELVGYLVDAFHTGKLGAESAQAAIKGLVPESVYSDLDTLDDKMSAVYKYFTEDLSDYFYVKFNDDGSLESAEMLVDNVKKFVEDGITNDVFTGSWAEGWGIEDSIHSIDELAKKMNVTKEVAFAFLQAMETYDISWIGGDASTLLDRLTPSISDIESLGKQMQEVFDQTSIDLTARVKVSKESMRDAGYTEFSDDYATTYSTNINSGDFGLYNDDGSTYEILATPILPNGDVLSKDGLYDYIRKELANGKSLKELDVFIGAYASVEEAEEAARVLSEAQASYYDMLAGYSLENDIYSNTLKQSDFEMKLATGEKSLDDEGVLEEYTKLQEESRKLADTARYQASEWSNINDEYETAKEKASELAEELSKMAKTDPEYAEKENELKKYTRQMYDAYTQLVMLGEPTEVTIQFAIDAVNKDIEEFKSDIEKNILAVNIKPVIENIDSVGFENLGLTKKSDGSWEGLANIVGYSSLDETSKSYVEQYLDLLSEQHELNIMQGEDVPTTLDILTQIKDILEKAYEIIVKADDALTTVQKFKSWWDGIKDKTVTLWQEVRNFFTRTPNDDGIEENGTTVNGTAHVHGTAYSTGSWGAKQTETSLVGELGPELLVRNGRWTTVGENGAEFTKVRKGDIIFNHKQTESLLKNGYVTGRGKAHASGTAFASGTAYKDGSVYPWTGGMNIDSDWSNISIPIWDAATNGEYLADAANEFEETLDFVEILLEEINEQLDIMNAKLENAANSFEKNDIIDDIIGVNETKMANLAAGLEKYASYAASLLADVPAQYRAAAQNGAIAITEFVGEANEATVKAIEKYREWSQKVSDLQKQLQEVKAEIRELYIQKIDNAQNTGDVKATVEDSQTQKLQNAVDLIETSGNIADDDYYVAMMENSNKKIEYLTAARNEMKKEFNDAVESGALIRGSDEWYENLDKLYQIDSEIANATKELEEFQNAINDIYWDNFDQLINRLDYINSDTQNLIDLMDDVDMLTHSEDRQYMADGEKYWTTEDVTWTKEGLATMGLYAQQMEVAEYKARQYAKAIDDLNKDYADKKYSESEYLEKLNELTDGQYDSIEAYQDAKKAIKDLNSEMVDMVKEGLEKQISAYEELAEKRKEALDQEKEAYDWQKSVSKQQKSISDIDRQIAAISGDNSITATAKRKRLEAERAELQSELDEMYYEKSIENQKDAIDKEVETFKKSKEEEIEQWDEYLDNVEQVIVDSLNLIKDNASGIYDTLSSKADEYSLTVSDAILAPWQDGGIAISGYQDAFDTAISSTTDKLELLEQRWQDVIDSTNDAAEAAVNAMNEQNAAYAAAEKKEVKVEAPKQQSATSSSSNTPSALAVGSSVTVKGSAKNFSGKSGGVKMASFVPGGAYTVYQVSGGEVLIGRDGVYTGWVNMSDIVGYSKGTTGVNDDQLALIDELGEELVMHADKNGRLAFLSKGTGVVPADLTSNLMEWGKLDPSIMLDQNRPVISAPHITNNETVINLEYGDILHIENLNGEKPENLSKMIDKAFDKHMKQLNSEIRRFTR